MKVTVHAHLSLGLVNVPVGVAPAVSKKEAVTFKQIHEECLTPIKQKKHCPKCDKEVTPVKGFEVKKDEFIVITDADIDSVKPERSSVIQITKFVDHLSPYSIEKNYWLTPEEPFSDAYATLWEAMGHLDVSGIGTSSLWGKEHPCVVQFDSRGLILGLLLGQSEVVKPDFTMPSVDKKAVEMASSVIETYRGELVDEDTESSQNKAMAEMIAKKVIGRVIDPAGEEVVEPTVDLMAALKAMMPKRVKQTA